jgi:integrase
MSRTPSRRNSRLVGFEYDPATQTARFSMYLPGTAGRERRRATVHAETYDQAVELWSEFRGRARTGLRRASPEAPTFREFIKDYLPSIEANVSPKTARDYAYAIDRHLMPAFGAMRLTEMSSGALNAFGARLKAGGYAGATVNNYMNLAALLLGYAVEFDAIGELPLKKKLKKFKPNKPCLELNPDEHARFLAAFDDEAGFRRYLAETMPRPKAVPVEKAGFGGRRAYGAAMRPDRDAAKAYFLRFQRSKNLFIADLESGLRRGDIRLLRIGHLSLGDDWIRLVQKKSGREVVIPISDTCRTAIERALADRGDPRPDDFVFVTEAGQPYSETTIRRYFAIAKLIAGITRRLRFHDLRHTFGSDLATAEVPLTFIGKVMGHANPATTARYARPDATVLKRVRQALNARA